MKAREFWIDLSSVNPRVYGVNDRNKYGIHVIEMSAYAELKKDAQELVDMLERMQDLFERDNGRRFNPCDQALTKWNEKYKGAK